MKRRAVEFTPEAQWDLRALYDWIADNSGPETALGYIERLERYCRGMELAAERGQRRDDIRPGMRVVGFERRVAIAFSVSDAQVVILRLLYGGQDWPASFD